MLATGTIISRIRRSSALVASQGSGKCLSVVISSAPAGDIGARTGGFSCASRAWLL
jgi:hypothetical protein